MNEDFNKEILFDNISFLLKEKGKKIGEFENDVDVSPGYVSRTSKDPKTKPGIDFIINAAKVLDTSIDVLLKANLSDLTPTERYLVSFLEKLTADTISDKLDWMSESAEYLNSRIECDINGNCDHPLFSLETFYEQTECEYPEEVTRPVFVSHTFDVHTYIDGNCFSLRMKNGMVLYVMKICKTVRNIKDADAYAIELWMCPAMSANQYLCSNRDVTEISSLVNTLYDVISQNMSHPKVKKDVKYVIDAFLKDDLEDDPVDLDDLTFT